MEQKRDGQPHETIKPKRIRTIPTFGGRNTKRRRLRLPKKLTPTLSDLHTLSRSSAASGPRFDGVGCHLEEHGPCCARTVLDVCSRWGATGRRIWTLLALVIWDEFELGSNTAVDTGVHCGGSGTSSDCRGSRGYWYVAGRLDGSGSEGQETGEETWKGLNDAESGWTWQLL